MNDDEFNYEKLQIEINKLQEGINNKSLKSCVIWAMDESDKQCADYREGRMHEMILFSFHFHADLELFRNERRSMQMIEELTSIFESQNATKN